MKKIIKNSIMIVMFCVSFQQISPMFHSNLLHSMKYRINLLRAWSQEIITAGTFTAAVYASSAFTRSLDKKYDLVKLDKRTGLHGLFTNIDLALSLSAMAGCYYMSDKW